jgi:hypothetical protein
MKKRRVLSSHSEVRAYSTVSRLGLNCPLENRGENASCDGRTNSASSLRPQFITMQLRDERGACSSHSEVLLWHNRPKRGSARAHSTASSWS